MNNQPELWDNFDPIEYVKRNYGEILPEDRMIIEKVITELKSMQLRKILLAADVGTGPNFYPAMLLASVLQPGGCIELIEFSKPNLDFMGALLDDPSGEYDNTAQLGQSNSINTREIWQKFDALIAEIGNEPRFTNTFARASTAAISIPGNIFKLPVSAYDFVSSYFVAESITCDKSECVKALTSLINSVRPRGGFMVALMVGSLGYSAGEKTFFPAVNLAANDIRNILNDIPGISAKVFTINSAAKKARPGYTEMAIVVGTC